MRILWVSFLLLCSCLFAKADVFTEEDFNQVVNDHSQVIFYFVSAGMPLSIKGLPNIQKVAREHQIDLIVLNDPHQPATLADGSTPAPIEATDRFMNQGIFLHFPSILLFKNGAQCGRWLPGFKTVAAYEKLVPMLESKCGAPAPDIHAFSPNPSAVWTPVVVSQATMATGILGYAYFTRALGSNWISYSTSNANFLFNRTNQTSFQIPGEYDGVPSPDGKLVTTPDPLNFYRAHDLTSDPENAANATPIFSDATMQQDYQSLGILKRKGSRTIYRVTTAWDTVGQIRDYAYSHGKLIALEPATMMCGDLNYSLPYLSRDGLRFGGSDNDTGDAQVYFIGKSGKKCELLADFPYAVSKVTFSPSGKWITFRAFDGRKIGIYALNLRTKKTVTVEEDAFPVTNVGFPDFLPNGHILFVKSTTGPTGMTLVAVEVKLEKSSSKTNGN